MTSSYQLDICLPEISAAHRLINGYKGKCNHLHGHNYSISVVVQSHVLTNQGFVIDFSQIKKIFGGWLLAHWDHVTLVIDKDIKLLNFLKSENMKYYLLNGYSNTTAEILSHYLFNKFQLLLSSNQVGVDLISVKVSENSRSSAIFRKNVHD